MTMMNWNRFCELAPLWMPDVAAAFTGATFFCLKGGLRHHAWPWIVLPILFLAGSAVMYFAPIYVPALDFMFSSHEFLYWLVNAVFRLAGWAFLFYGLFWKLPQIPLEVMPLSRGAKDAATLASVLAVLLLEMKNDRPPVEDSDPMFSR